MVVQLQMLDKIVEDEFAAESLAKVKLNADAVVVSIGVEMLINVERLFDSYYQNLSKS